MATASGPAEFDPMRLELLLAARRVSELRDLAARHGVDISRQGKRKEIARALASSPAAADIWSEIVPAALPPDGASMDVAEAVGREPHAKAMERARVGIDEIALVMERAAAIGAELALARRALDRAREALVRNDPARSLLALEQAEGRAREAVAARVEDIEEGLETTESLIGEARNVGADVTEAERLLDQARGAFREKQVLLAGELVRRSERSAMRSQQDQIAKAMDLRRRGVDRGMGILRAVEPLLVEAESYGIDISEPRVLIEQARDVLGTGDYVSGTLFARNAAAAVRILEPRLLEERVRRGIAKPSFGVCARCGSGRMTFRDDGRAQCLACGHIARWRSPFASFRRLRRGPRP